MPIELRMNLTPSVSLDSIVLLYLAIKVSANNHRSLEFFDELPEIFIETSESAPIHPNLFV
jgi:hypothetical protein